jgi:hypothetical protein
MVDSFFKWRDQGEILVNLGKTDYKTQANCFASQQSGT